MAEAAFKRTVSSFIRQTRPQSLRSGKPPSYLQRRPITSATTAQPQEALEDIPQWQSHSVRETRLPQSNSDRRERLRTDPRTFSSFLTDTYSRQHNYLRISVTERCNLRCVYCMPEEGVPLSPPDHLLTTPEIVYLSSIFVNQGVDKIRLTGGEPTIRKDIVSLMHQIGQLRSNGLKELCITTNGISLHRKLDSMVDSGLTGVNLSLDTLDPFQFTLMTRRNGHEAVMKSINRILEMNKQGAGVKLKINCVVMRGLNEREIIPFVEMGREQDLEVRFIEYMPFDGNKWSEKKMLSFHEMLATIRQKYPDVHKIQDHANDTSKTYQIPGFLGRIGFITSMTHNFCGSCNRLRITGDGNLKVCLFGNAEVSLRDILRQANDGRPIDLHAMEAIKQLEMDRHQGLPGSTGAFGASEREAKLLEVIGMAVKRKKEKHAGIGQLENMKNRPMILIDEDRSLSVETLSMSAISSSLYRNAVRPFSNIPVHLLNSHSAFASQTRSMSSHTSRQGCSQGHWRNWRNVNSQARFPRPENPPGSRNARPFSIVGAIYKVHNKDAQTSGYPSERGTTSPTKLSHLTEAGEAHMISIGHKIPTSRSATATSTIVFSHTETYNALLAATLQKGDAMAVARIAGIQAAKKTSDLIPLAHPGLGITGIRVDIRPFTASAPGGTSEIPTKLVRSSRDPDKHAGHEHGGVTITATVDCEGKTGVEMEALTAATVAGLAMYDMLKGVDKGMVLTGARVIAKKGGKSGDWTWDPAKNEIVKETSR